MQQGVIILQLLVTSYLFLHANGLGALCVTPWLLDSKLFRLFFSGLSMQYTLHAQPLSCLLQGWGCPQPKFEPNSAAFQGLAPSLASSGRSGRCAPASSVAGSLNAKPQLFRPFGARRPHLFLPFELLTLYWGPEVPTRHWRQAA